MVNGEGEPTSDSAESDFEDICADATVSPQSTAQTAAVDEEAIDQVGTDESELERFMWEDPFGGAEFPCGVLLADDITNYVGKGLLIDFEDFNKDNLKGASYSLTPDIQGGWYFSKDGQQKVLEVNRSEGAGHFIVPKNSIAFIRIKEKIRIPYYMIGRHNLTIRYVYLGLLLGTGPQVDPGYQGQLIIPLHNLTDADVEIKIDESFVSIDFTKTMPLNLRGETAKTDEEFRSKFPEKKLISLTKVTKRKKLLDYLNGNRPRSSMRGVLDSLKVAEDKVAENERNVIEVDKARQHWNAGIVIGGISLLLALLFSLIAMIDNDYKDLNGRLCSVAPESLKHRISDLEQRISEFEKSAVSDLEKRIEVFEGSSVSKTNVLTYVPVQSFGPYRNIVPMLNGTCETNFTQLFIKVGVDQ